MAGYFNGSVYAEIADSSNLSLISTSGWTFSFFLYPDTGLTEPDFGYIYNHGSTLVLNDAFSVIRGGFGVQPYNTIRVVVDWVGASGLVDFTSTNTLNNDEWNRVIITYVSGGDLIIAINGASDSMLPSALPDNNPIGTARIGYSTAGGTRNFPGRIAHAAKYDREFLLADAEAFSGTFLSPEFAQRDLTWHAPMFSDAVWDRQNNVDITPQGMEWRPHGPFIYPAKDFNGRGSGGLIPPGGEDTWRYFRVA